jgi:hypothetical protein
MHGPTCIFWANLTPLSLQEGEGHHPVQDLHRSGPSTREEEKGRITAGVRCGYSFPGVHIN